MPKKSVQRVSQKLNISCSTVHDVLCKHSRFHAYKIQYMQQSLKEDCVLNKKSACLMLQNMDDYLKHFVFSDEATFHVSGYVNRHN
jgi:hypothetical protein